MITRLEGYDLGHLYAIYCNRADTIEALLAENLRCIQLEEQSVRILPCKKRFSLDYASYENLLTCANHDVFEIHEDGRMFRCYSDKASDNVIFITGRCNSSCVMCPDSDTFRARAPIRSLDSLLAMIECIPSDVQHLTITGGEPFMLGKDFFSLLTRLRERFHNTEFLLLTNGRVLCLPEYCNELLRTMPPQTTIAIPIHGFDAQSHDAITRAPGSFEQTIRGAKRLLSLGARVELRIVVSKLSANYLESIASLIISELSATACVKFIALEMLGNAAKNENSVWIPYSEGFKKSKAAIIELVSHGIDVGLYNFPLCAVESEFWPICEKSISDYKVRFASECDRCYVKDACGGVFAGTRHLAFEDLQALERPSK